MKIVLNFSLSILLLYIIFRVINVTTLLNILSEIKYPYLLLAIVFQLFSTLVASCRWYMIMKLPQFKEPHQFFIKSYLKDTFFNQVCPSSIGGDAVRVH